MNGQELEELFIPLLGEKSWRKKLADLSLFTYSAIYMYSYNKRKIIPAHEKYFHLLAEKLGE